MNGVVRFGLVERKQEVRTCLDAEVDGDKPRRPWKMWMKVVSKDRKTLGIRMTQREDEFERVGWRWAINRDRLFFMNHLLLLLMCCS